MRIRTYEKWSATKKSCGRGTVLLLHTYSRPDLVLLSSLHIKSVLRHRSGYADLLALVLLLGLQEFDEADELASAVL